MSDFFEDEAEESSDEDIVGTKKKPVIGLDDDKSASEDDAEDEEAVDKHLAAEADDQGNIRGLIDDNVDEEEEESDGSDSEVSSEEDEKGKAVEGDDEEVEEEIGKAKRRKRQYDHRLEDDDLDLIEENLGVKLKRKKFSRLKTVSSDEDDSDKEDNAEGGARENVANEIFANQDFDEDAPQENRRPEPVITAVTEEEEESEESDVDDFIVDDNNEPISKPHAPGHKKKRKGDAALQNLHDIFGVDFDFSEFEKYGDQYEDDEEMEMEDEYYDEMDEEGIIGDAELRPKKKSKKAKKKKSIFDVYEPDTLERGYFTDFDAEIRNADVPERFQLRAIPVRPADDAELELEAEWIYRHGFVETTVSKQENFDDIGSSSSLNRKPHSAIAKIQDSLNFMRNQQFEMPFIAFYRKEYVEPELNIHDLNKIYHWDEKWTQLLNRKANLTRLLQKMQTYQYEQISSDPDRPLGDNVRALTDADVERIQSVQTMDELKDVYAHFLLHYGRDIPKMQNALRSRRQRERNEDGTVPEGEEAQASDLKQASRRDMYTVCLNAGLGGVANKFGLTPEQFGENLRDNYQRHETEQYPAEPNDLAQDFITPQFDTAEKVLEGARYMMAMQLTREPLVRQCVRQTFQERAKINVKPTKKGKKEIDEAHPLYSVKYLKNKPIRDLTGPIFLHMVNGESERLIEIDIRIDMKGSDITASHTYFEEIKQLYYRDEFSQLVQEWNSQRSQVVEMMLNKILYPEMVKEVRATLLREAKEGIINHCALTLRKWLAVAPYQPEEREDEEELDGRQGCTVMAVAYSDNRDSATFAAVISSDGEVTDFLRLPFMRVRKNASNEEDRKRKEKDLENIKQFILKRKPHVIVVAAEDRFALMLQEDIKACVTELEQEGSSAVSVEIMDNELAAVYAATKRAETDFRDYPAELRQAVSLARKMQDPMLEFSQLCSQDDDLLCLKFHPLQDQVDKDQLLINLIEEFVFRACEVGVDVNRAIAHPHTTNVVQFVCGLGPRKAAHLVKVLKQKNGRLENRSNLVTVCRMGPKIFINCAAFIKIDTSSLGDSTDVYIEVLDGLRVHPETYEWARKMAVDALEYDESAEDANPSSALEEILESPERLKDLDLDAFADELERQGYGNKGITLYDIRNELDCRYKDLRTPYRPPTAEERFSLITKETLDTFQEGKLVTCRAVGIAYRRPKAEQLDLAEPHKDENTGTWSCSFCGTGGFGELSEVWSHLDSGDCLGKAVGVRTRLDNGVSGFIPTDRLSDSKVNNPEERVKVGMTIHCRIVKIDIDKFQVDLSSKSSDLRNENEKWGSVFDTYYDHDTEDLDKQSSQNSDKNKNRTTYIKRVIAHPSFHNVGFKEAEKILESMDQGDVVIRPSSKGSDHLTATWKVGENVYAHIDVKEEGKENSFSLGKTLLIGNDEFEDLDEIIARFVQPMAANARDILNHKYYRESNGGKKDILEEQLKQAKKHAPSRIPYFLSVCKELPGKFLLSYMPRTKPKHEYITVLSDGFRYRGQVFTTINQLFKWFKEHFRDPIPMHLMPSRTPAGATSNSTESGGSRFNVAAIQNALQSMQQTPRAAGQFATPLPRTQPYVTPNAAIIPRTPNYPPQRTPGYGAPQTPIQRTPASFTPHNRTPMAWGHPPAAVPPMRTPVGGGNPAGTDWGKAAEEWARKKVPRGTPRRTPSGSTPRGPRTPAGSYRGSPRTPVHRTPRDGSAHA